MTDKKKKYLAPQMTVVEIEKADIICTSGYETDVLSEDEFEW